MYKKVKVVKGAKQDVRKEIMLKNGLSRSLYLVLGSGFLIWLSTVTFQPNFARSFILSFTFALVCLFLFIVLFSEIFDIYDKYTEGLVEFSNIPDNYFIKIDQTQEMEDYKGVYYAKQANSIIPKGYRKLNLTEDQYNIQRRLLESLMSDDQEYILIDKMTISTGILISTPFTYGDEFKILELIIVDKHTINSNKEDMVLVKGKIEYQERRDEQYIDQKSIKL